MQEFLLTSTIVLWIVTLLNLLLIFALIRRINEYVKAESPGGYRHAVPPNMLQIGEEAPAFVATSLDGREVTNADYHGDILVLTFISHGCAPCIELIAHFNSLHTKIVSSGLKFILVSLDRMEDVQNSVARSPTEFPIVVAPKTSNMFGEDYKVPGTPSTYVISSDNKIKWAGHVPLSELENLIIEWTS